MPLDRIVVGRILAHVDTAFPDALERVGDIELHFPDAVDLDPHALAILEKAKSLVVRTAENCIAGIERHDPASEGDDLWNAEKRYVLAEEARFIGRLHGSWYVRTGDQFALERPR